MIQVQTLILTITGKKLHTCFKHLTKARKANISGLLGEIVNAAGMHLLRRTAVIEIREQTRFKTTAFLGHKKHTNYFQPLTR
jgi:hypothetical protein